MWIPVCRMCYCHCLVISHVSMKFCNKHCRGATCLWNITWPLCISSWLAWKTSLCTAVMKPSQITYILLCKLQDMQVLRWIPLFMLQFTTKTVIAHCILIFWEISTNNSVARDYRLRGITNDVILTSIKNILTFI